MAINKLHFARKMAAILAIFFGVSVPGGLVLGTALQNGDFFAITCVDAGLSLAFGMWWYLSARPEYLSQFKGITLAGACLISGLALYSNLAYLIWITGAPLSLGIVHSGKMAEHFWLPPATLLYAVFVFYGLKRGSKEPGRSR